MKRDFIVLHSRGGTRIRAHSAGEALRRAYVPLGYRDTRAVIEQDMLGFPASGGAFAAFLAAPALPSQKGGAA